MKNDLFYSIFVVYFQAKKRRVNFEEDRNDKSVDGFGKREIMFYNETSNNGSIIENKIIPDELLSKILCYTEPIALLQCQLVCKHWFNLIQNYVWHKRAELTVRKTLPSTGKTPWTIYYFICEGKPFYKNLIKNHSGEFGLLQNWNITENGGDGWNVECPPKAVRLLPDDPVFEDKNFCFVTSFSKCWKEQVVNLIDEGFTEYCLDYLQPTIKVPFLFSIKSYFSYDKFLTAYNFIKIIYFSNICYLYLCYKLT